MLKNINLNLTLDDQGQPKAMFKTQADAEAARQSGVKINASYNSKPAKASKPAKKPAETSTQKLNRGINERVIAGTATQAELDYYLGPGKVNDVELALMPEAERRELCNPRRYSDDNAGSDGPDNELDRGRMSQTDWDNLHPDLKG